MKGQFNLLLLRVFDLLQRNPYDTNGPALTITVANHSQ